MVQQGLPTPYNLKGKKNSYLTTPMKKLLAYIVILLLIGTAIFKAIPDNSQELTIELDTAMEKERLAIAKLQASDPKTGPELIQVAAVEKPPLDTTKLIEKKRVSDLDKLKEDLIKIGQAESKEDTKE